MEQTAVITGAGSGVGRALALKLAALGWRAALLGRRADALAETVRLAGAKAGRLSPHTCDVGDASAVKQTAQTILAEFGTVEVLVNAAGINVPARALAVLTLPNYETVVQTNLHGTFHCVQAFLPAMRTRHSGTIVNVISEAGKHASPKAGAGYVVSKFGLAGLTQSINAEERANGIRACALFPGDIDTPLLEHRPHPPDAAARARMMRAEDVAECALFCIQMPAHVIVEEMLVRSR